MRIKEATPVCVACFIPAVFPFICNMQKAIVLYTCARERQRSSLFGP